MNNKQLFRMFAFCIVNLSGAVPLNYKRVPIFVSIFKRQSFDLTLYRPVHIGTLFLFSFFSSSDFNYALFSSLSASSLGK